MRKHEVAEGRNCATVVTPSGFVAKRFRGAGCVERATEYARELDRRQELEAASPRPLASSLEEMNQRELDRRELNQ